MKREIKFRAWLNDEEKIVYSNDQASTESCEVWIFYDGGLKIQVQETVWREGGGETFERIEYVDCNHVIMQYTGLTDKNGKGNICLYEGDILSLKGELIGNIYEYEIKTHERESYIVVPKITSKEWMYSIKKIMGSGFGYSE